MTNKIIIIGVICVLVVGLAFLGLEVKSLKSEIAQLSALKSDPVQQHQTPIKQKFRKPDEWWIAFNNNRWDPYNELAQIQRQMNRLLNQRFQGPTWNNIVTPTSNIYNLSTDIKDAKDKYVVNMDIPGMDKDNINVEVKNNTIFISGERNSENEENNANYYKKERSFGYFSQALPLPEDADSSKISVNYDKGVLNVEIPKLAKSKKTQEPTIKIKVN